MVSLAVIKLRIIKQSDQQYFVKTIILKLDPNDPDEYKLREVAKIARDGGLVAFPTETVYGLGTNAFNERAVRRLFEVKRRPPDNPVSVLISDVKQIDRLGELNDVARKLINEYFPGPITVVMKAKPDVPSIITAGTGKVAVRMPDHPIALKIVEFAEVPLATPSANVSGKPSPTKAEHVIEDFMGKIDAIVDGGETGIGIESTVIDTTTYPPKILRLGAIPAEEIEDLIGKVEVSEAPSMKYVHYKPKSKLIVIFGDDRETTMRKIAELVKEYRRRGMSVGVGLKKLDLSIDADLMVEMGDDVKEYARKLFDTLRKFDGVDVGIVEGMKGRGLAKAIMNRLIEASDEILEL